MYDLILNMLGIESFTSGYNSTVLYICAIIISVLLFIVCDLIYRIFRHFWR